MGDVLRLVAEDAADLEVISAAVQDAVVRAGDIAFDARARRFTMALNRFRWERASSAPPERVRAALSFESVDAVQSRRLRRDRPEAIAALLALEFAADPEPPGGSILIRLAGDGDLRLQVECIDVSLTDLGAPWGASGRPQHPLEQGS